VGGATGGASKKKKIILFSSIGVVSLVAIITGLIFWLGGDDEKEKDDQIADKGGQETPPNQEDEQGDDDKGGGSGTNDEIDKPSGAEVASLSEVPLLERIPSDVLAVALIDYGKMLEKGGQGLLTLIPPDASEVLVKVLKDPTAIGLDPSGLLQVTFLQDSTNSGDEPIMGLAGKLGDAAKFKTVLELLPDMEKPEQKDGFELYLLPDDKSCLALTEDYFLIQAGDSQTTDMDDLTANVEKFVHSDGTDSLAKSSASLQAFAKAQHDAAIWINGKALSELPSDEELPEELTSMFEAGSAVISLDFENGEAVLVGELQIPEGFERFGNGGLSEGMTNLIPAKALAALSLSLDMKAVVDYLEKVVLPAAGDPVSLDEVIPQLGIKPRDVLETFTGEISVALTEFSMSGAGLVPNEDLPTKVDSTSAKPEEDPFGGGGDEQPPAEVDPFGGSPEPQPAPGQGFPGGPEDGPPGGGPGMGGGLPVEFIAALSVDPANWEKLKAAPPLTMAMGLAMLQGISVTVKDDRLLVASKKHIAEAMEGSVKNKLSGSELFLFKENDFALKLDIAEAAKLEGIPLPPPLMDNLKKLSYLAITGKSHEKGSSGALRIGFADKQTNSLKSLVELVPILQPMLLGGGGADSPGLPDEGGF